MNNTLTRLKDYATKIQYFGLGMIRIDIGANIRYNFYTNKFNPSIERSIHTHKYTFNSTVLAGNLQQRIYYEVEGTKGVSLPKFSVNCNCGEEEPIFKKDTSLLLTFNGCLSEGSIYNISSGTIHSVNPTISSLGGEAVSKCITRMVKRPDDTMDAFVYQKDKGFPSPFIEVPEKDLWEEVGVMLDLFDLEITKIC